eukprot:TRINITY_DN955_c0_g1_i1.p1 TRINITY_DN955_c0_g1~~TRINITY_DN955_c0_g1_i1.p1  ORF type:complete len:1169 (+),score=358.96 TRINITY_DN955_c0_g1_i1:92-3508(+)
MARRAAVVGLVAALGGQAGALPGASALLRPGDGGAGPLVSGPAAAWQCLWTGSYHCAPAAADQPGAFATEAACTAACTKPQPEPDPLQRWLHDQTFTIPRFTVNKSGVVLGLSLRCSHLGVGYFEAQRRAAAGGFSLAADLYGLRGDCAGAFDVTLSKPLPLSGSGTVAVSVMPDSYAGVNVSLSGGQPPVAADIICRRSGFNFSTPVFGPAGSAIAALLNTEGPQIRAILDAAWPGVVCPMLHNLAQTKLTPILALIAAEIKVLTPTPPAPPQPSAPGIVDFPRSPWLRLAEWLLGEVFAEPPVAPNPGLNWLMRLVTHSTGGITLPVNLSLPQVAVPLAGGSSVAVSLSAVTLRGLDTVRHAALLQLSNATPHALSSLGDLGQLSGTVYLSVVALDPAGKAAPAQPMEFGLDASRLQLRLGAAAAVRKDPIESYSVWQLLKANCSLPAMDSANLTKLWLNGSLDNFAAATGSRVGLDNLLVQTVLMFRDAYGAAAVSALDALISGPISDKVNTAVAGVLAQKRAENSSDYCGNGIPDPITADGDEYQALGSAGGVAGVAVACGVGTLLLVACIFCILTRWRQRSPPPPPALARQDKEVGAAAAAGTPDLVAPGDVQGGAKGVPESTPRAVMSPRAQRSKLPTSLAAVAAPDPFLYLSSLIWNILVPLLLLLTVGLRVFGLSTTICKVELLVDVGNRTIVEELAINFSFSQLIKDFFDAGAWLVSVLIILGSAVMPCLNIFAMFCLWFIPLCSGLRGQLLFLVNQGSKLSFIDVYFIATITYLFHSDYYLGPAVAKLRPDPLLGIYGGMAGTALQKVLSSLLLHMHRDYHPAPRASRYNTLRDADEDTDDDSHDGQTVTTTKGGGHNVRLCATGTRRTNAVAAVLLTISFTTWVISLAAPLITFHISGLLGRTQTEEETRRAINAWTFPKHLGDCTTQKAGAAFINTIYLVLVLVGPAVCYVCWALTWFVPLPMHAHRFCGSLAEHIFAWHGTDVLLVTTFASWAEMDKIASFLVSSSSDLMDKTDSLVDHYLNERILEMKSHWEWGSLMLLFCAITAAALFNFTYAQETVRQQMCNAERRRLKGERRAGERKLYDGEGERAAYAAAAAAYEDEDKVSSSGRSTVIPRVAAQYCSIQ